MENTSTKIGAQIKQLRLAAGMTQRELAQRINVGNTTLSQYESGARVPSDEVKLKIAKSKMPAASAVAQRPAEVAITGELHNLSDRQLDRLMGYIQALKELPDSTTPQNVAIAEKNASEENSSAAG